MEKVKKGDILVLDSRNGWSEEALAWLTNSSLGSCAVVLDEKRLIRCGVEGCSRCNYSVVEKGVDVYRYRMQPGADVEKFLEAARYYAEEAKYAFPAAAVLACLCLYRRGPATRRYGQAVEDILLFAMEELDALLSSQRAKDKSEKKAIYVPLLRYCFQVCGYDPGIPEGAWQCFDSDMGGGDTFFTPILRITARLSRVTDAEAPGLARRRTLKELAQELCLAATEENPQYGDTPPLAVNIELLLERMETFYRSFSTGLPIDAYFTTPAELIYHAKRLKYYGRSSLKLLFEERGEYL